MQIIRSLLAKTVIVSLAITTNAWADPVKVYAAASLTNAITDIAKQFEAQNPDVKVTPVFASSSNLAKQIEAGAPADIFFSADEKWMKYLVDKSQVDASKVKPLLGNELVVISPVDRKFKYQPSTKFNFASAFKGNLCTGQTESVPVGIYAKQSLTNLGWFDALKGRIVGADDVRAALAFVERGECDAGIVYATDAKVSNKVQVIGELPAASHQPIVYPIAPTKQASNNADALKLLNYIQTSPKAKATFIQYGFSVKP